jgi:hypothetical protein
MVAADDTQPGGQPGARETRRETTMTTATYADVSGWMADSRHEPSAKPGRVYDYYAVVKHHDTVLADFGPFPSQGEASAAAERRMMVEYRRHNAGKAPYTAPA